MAKEWKQRPHDLSLESDLLKAGYTPLISRLLSQRGVTADKARAFLDASPAYLSPVSSLHGIRKATTIMLKGSLVGESVAVIGDYDVDGVLSTAMMKSICDDLHMPFRAFLPSRFDHGYGLNNRTVTSFLEQCGSTLPDILVTCDCGTSSEKWVKHLKQAGIGKILVIDHHIVEEQSLSLSADAVVNWRLGGSEMCAAGHVFFLARALKEAAAEVNVDALAAYAAVATIADVTPIKGDNRIIVRNGLKMFQDSTSVGLSMLAAKCELDHRNISQEDVSFKIAPRINAPGRMSHCNLSYDLVTETDYATAMEKANEIESINMNRRAVQQKIEEDCVGMIGEGFTGNGILVMDKAWHTGVIGIVAAGIARRYGVPCILMGEMNGEIKGSGRSIPGVNIKAIMDRCCHMFEGYGGHEAAAGS
jgi:single-stranded-DNA-specific exonuclease